jgi:glycosyltransferase involved in cell wall biosynthesis
MNLENRKLPDDLMLSIVIPTKNRYKYLKEALNTLSKIDSSHFEIVIHDNSDNNEEIIEYLNINSFKNVRYLYEKNYLSVSENSSRGLDSANGKYVCMIGDDDSVSTKIVDVVKWMSLNQIDTCIFNLARFYWSDIEFKRVKYSTLSFIKKPGHAKKLSAKKELIKSIEIGGTSLLKMPKVYHGIASKKILMKIKEKYGTYFPGPSPDMANAAALALLSEHHYYIPVPIIISGYSFKSTGGMGTRGNHLAELKDVVHISKEQVELWEEKNPKYWLPQTVWAESLIKALKNANSDLYTQFNWNYLYAHIYLNYKFYRRNIKVMTDKKFLLYLRFNVLKLNKLFSFIKGVFKFKLNIINRVNIKEKLSLSDAQCIVDNSIDKYDLLKHFKKGDKYNV